MDWFREACPALKLVTTDYRELLARDDVDAVYVALPHDLHEEVYCAAIEAGKHLFGEKPFGIDLAANERILACTAAHPQVLVRCCSQFPYFPAMQQIGKLIEEGALGPILEVNAGFLHSSDLNPAKPINWKRVVATNGEHGVMGDLGMHVCHVPFRAGWTPRNVRAVLSNVRPTRPNAQGELVECGTWDNATLLCECDSGAGHSFPMVLRTQRIAPGEMNTWMFEAKGEKACARFTTRNPVQFEYLAPDGSGQHWQARQAGHAPTFPVITGGIFEFGFTDAILQMWAAFVEELAGAPLPGLLARAATPQEANLSHRLFTAAQRSHREASTVAIC
jgi:predicted dehydrogenase